MDLSEKMVDTKPGDIILDTEITMKMMFMEFWQDSIKNEAGLVFMLDGQKVCGADAYSLALMMKKYQSKSNKIFSINI